MIGDFEMKEIFVWVVECCFEICGLVQVYKSIYYGVVNGDYQVWFNVVKFENVVISVGENNYGYLIQVVFDFYQKNNLCVYCIDCQGIIIFKGKVDGFYVVVIVC